MIGLDSGFFVELLRQNPEATRVWRSLIEDKDQGLVCSLTLFEIERLRLKGALPQEAEVLFEAIPAVCKVAWIRSTSLLTLGAKLSHGLGIPAFDSLILASFVEEKAEVIYTTDSHLECYRKRGVEIINLKSLASCRE